MQYFFALPRAKIKVKLYVSSDYKCKSRCNYSALSYFTPLDKLWVRYEVMHLKLSNRVNRRAVTPWWIIDLINEAVRHSRSCRWLDKKASIRGSTKGIDHTYASVELENRNVANLKDAVEGLKLALRGRIGLRADLIDFENPKKNFEKSDEIVEYLFCKALANLDLPLESDKEKFTQELNSLLKKGTENLTQRFSQYPELNKVVQKLKNIAKDKITDDLNETEKELASRPEKVSRTVLEEYNYSILETICNLAWHRKLVGDWIKEKIFVPQTGGFS